MPLAEFSVDTTDPGHPLVSVNGEDISARVRQVAVNAPAGVIPTVLIEVSAGARIEGTGVVQIDSGADPSSVVLDWLGNLDADELERVALESMGGFGTGSTGEAFVAVLKGWVGGDAART